MSEKLEPECRGNLPREDRKEKLVENRESDAEDLKKHRRDAHCSDDGNKHLLCKVQPRQDESQATNAEGEIKGLGQFKEDGVSRLGAVPPDAT